MQAEFVLHCGSGYPAPYYDKWTSPAGEVLWVEPDVAAVSTSGPSLSMLIDFSIPYAAGQEQIVVVRILDQGHYLPTAREVYQDPDQNLCVSLTVMVPQDGKAEKVHAVIPYACFPARTYGIVEIEVAVHDPDGPLTAIGHYHVEIPEDVDRVPDLLSVMAHTMVAVARARSKLTRDDVKVIRELLRDNFDLDDIGDSQLRQILKIANRTPHSTETLAEVCAFAVPPWAHERFVNVIYATADRDGEITKKTQAFIDELLGRLEIYDHKRLGPERLRPHFETLELAPDATLDEVKKAYRKLVRDYHPDRVQNLAQGFIDYANQRIIAINEAYKLIKEALDTPRPVEVELEFDED